MNSALYKKLCRVVPPFYGNNLSGLPLGEDQNEEIDFRNFQADEDLTKKSGHDPLVAVGKSLLTRPMYFLQGLGKDEKLFLRKPALEQCVEYDKLLKKVGWRLRICDAYRPAKVQQRGFVWSVSEILYRDGTLSFHEFMKLLTKAVKKGVTPKETRFLIDRIKEADQFFLYVPLKKNYNPKKFAKNVPEVLLTAAANLGIEGLEIDPYALTAHNTGGVVDVEWVNEKTQRLVNVGVPVDTPDVIAAFPYFEPEVATLFSLIPEFKDHKLANLKNRKAYYRKLVKDDSLLQLYLMNCGVDLMKFFQKDSYFNSIWEEIYHNRRVVSALAEQVGMVPFGRETWHFDCNDERGGVRHKRTGIVSGGGSYALHHGQNLCAWGCARALYEKLGSTDK